MNCEKINEVISLSKKVKECVYDEHQKYTDPLFWFDEIKNELDEAIVEYKNGEDKLLEEELGDVIWDFIRLVVTLTHLGKVDIDKSLEHLIKKINHRMPYLANSEKINYKEAREIWKSQKKKEKESDNFSY
jgi:NTP pyrophosphatase (non-canonical NTP hydrolase)